MFSSDFRVVKDQFQEVQAKRTKGRAEKKAIEMFITGDAVTSDITFRDYSKDFFDWNGKWVLDKRSKGKRLSSRQCSEYTNILENNLIQVFGKFKI
jgi:hypothetical protein